MRAKRQRSNVSLSFGQRDQPKGDEPRVVNVAVAGATGRAENASPILFIGRGMFKYCCYCSPLESCGSVLHKMF